MWETIKFITTPFTLIAFIAAVIYYLKKVKLRTDKEKLISTPEEERAELLLRLEDKYNFNVEGLARDQRYNLIKDEIENKYKTRLNSQKLAAFIAALLAVILCVSIVISDKKEEATDEVINKEETIKSETDKLETGKIENEKIETSKIAGFDINKSEIDFRIKQMKRAVIDAEKTLLVCEKELEKDAAILGINIQNLIYNTQRISLTCELGGITKIPGSEGDNIWFNNSGFGIRHLPNRKSFKHSEFNEFSLIDLISNLKEDDKAKLEKTLDEFTNLSCGYPFLEIAGRYHLLTQRTSYKIRREQTIEFNGFIAKAKDWINKNAAIIEKL